MTGGSTSSRTSSGAQLDRRKPGNERQDDAGHHQQDGRGNLQPRGDDRDRGDHRQQQDQNLKRVRHPAAASAIFDAKSRNVGWLSLSQEESAAKPHSKFGTLPYLQR